MPDDGGLRRPRYGPSTSTALSPIVIDVTPARRRTGLLSLSWVAVLAAVVGFVVASLAVGARNPAATGIARLWLPSTLAEAPAPVALADVAPQPRGQELPEPERPPPPPAPIAIAPPPGPIGPLGEPLPDPAAYAAADALPVIPVPAEPPPAPAVAGDFEQWIGRLTGIERPARPARPPQATPRPAPPPAFRTGLPPTIVADSTPAGVPAAIPAATPAGSAQILGQLPTLPPARTVSRSVPIPPGGGAQLAAAPPASRAAPAWKRHARPFEANDQRPRIAIVVTELGLSQAMTDQAIQFLPGPITLAFNAYAETLDKWVERARGAGHEVLINLPMEPANFPANDPGPQALLTSLSAQQNLARLEWILGRVDGFVGVAAIHGGRFVASAQSLQPVMASLRDRGVIYVEKTVGTPSMGPALARELGVPRVVTDRWIDLDPSRGAIDQRLAEIERIARDQGAALAVAQPLPVSYERLAIWQTTLQGKGIVLVPVSAVVDQQRDR